MFRSLDKITDHNKPSGGPSAENNEEINPELRKKMDSLLLKVKE